VHVLEGGRGRLSANTIEANRAAGVAVGPAAGTQMSGNFVQDNDGPGVTVSGVGKAVLAHNEIAGNGAVGVLLCDGADPILEKNGIRENRSHGVHSCRLGRGRLLRNMIERNGACGIYAEEGCAVTLGENYVQHNEEEEVVRIGASEPTGGEQQLRSLQADDDVGAAPDAETAES